MQAYEEMHLALVGGELKGRVTVGWDEEGKGGREETEEKVVWKVGDAWRAPPHPLHQPFLESCQASALASACSLPVQAFLSLARARPREAMV